MYCDLRLWRLAEIICKILQLFYLSIHMALFLLMFPKFYSPTVLQDLLEFVNDSGDDGFIVFTLGSMVDGMPEEKAKLFLDAFRQIPQRVIKS